MSTTNDPFLELAIKICNENGVHVKTDLDRADLKKFYQLRYVIEGFKRKGDFPCSEFVEAIFEEYGRVND
jgi:hypothetical protein